MDLSKLPKLSESPAPPAQAPMAEYAQPSTPQIHPIDVGVEILLSLILGAVFLMLGAPFGGWLIAKMGGKPYPTGVAWQDGTPVEFFDLQGGTAWLYMGEWVLGAALILCAVVLMLGYFRRSLLKRIIALCLILAIIGALSNVVAVVMQIKAGFTQPIFSLLGILVGGVTAFFYARHFTARE